MDIGDPLFIAILLRNVTKDMIGVKEDGKQEISYVK